MINEMINFSKFLGLCALISFLITIIIAILQQCEEIIMQSRQRKKAIKKISSIFEEEIKKRIR